MSDLAAATVPRPPATTRPVSAMADSLTMAGRCLRLTMVSKSAMAETGLEIGRAHV